ncbi:hypothetical protein N7G274_009495 [Stereocaulon virgatum]|uniref:BED-type domain-containing protein n=1 Tax=Stereocaulon virgatum TaxID=373712 RepID=A0ABR3ZYC7_9LECA
MPRDKSLAWAHFEKVGQGLYKQDQVKCKYCRRQSAGQAGKVDAHLKRCTEYAIQLSHEKNGGLPAGPIESYTHRISPGEQARLDKKLALALFAGRPTIRNI